MLNLISLMAIFIACLIVGLFGFLNGLNGAKWVKEEIDRKRKLKAILELVKEKDDEQR